MTVQTAPRSLSEQRQVITNYQREAPVNVVPIANALGINVYKVPGWPSDLSGMIKSDTASPGGFSIFVNANHAVNRRRFTIAHEIAHAVLHPHLIGDGITDDALLRSGLPDPVEYQANKMAADILMPHHLLDPLLQSGITDVSELARRFRVSDQAMSIRLGVPQ